MRPAALCNLARVHLRTAWARDQPRAQGPPIVRSIDVEYRAEDGEQGADSRANTD